MYYTIRQGYPDLHKLPNVAIKINSFDDLSNVKELDSQWAKYIEEATFKFLQRFSFVFLTFKTCGPSNT